MDVHQYINEPGISLDERSRRKTASHALIYGASPQGLARILAPRRFGFRSFGMGFRITAELLKDDIFHTEVLRRIRMQSLPLHLQDLDEGDLRFMKQMGWNEMEYRIWLFETVEPQVAQDQLKLGQSPIAASQEELRQAESHGLASVEGPIRGRHYDRIIADDIGETPGPAGGFVGRPSSFTERPLGKPPGLGASYGAQVPQPPAPPTVSSVIQQRRNTIMAFKDELEHRYQVMAKARDIANQTPPTDASYHGALSEVFHTTLAYLEVAQNFLNQTSINMSLPDIGSGPVMAQGVGRG